MIHMRLIESNSQTSPANQQNGLDHPRRAIAALTVMAGIGMATLNASIVNVALPSLSLEFSIHESLAIWIVNAYNLVTVMLLLPFSNLAERFGFKRFFTIGLVIFTAASLACAWSTTFPQLLIARMIQAVGSAILMSMFGGLTKHIHPSKRLGFGISLNASTVALMAVLGPTIGASVLHHASWPWLFLVTIPLCVFALMGTRYLPNVLPQRRPIDGVSMFLCMCALGLFVSGLNRLGEVIYQGLLMLGVSLIVTIYLVIRSSKQTAPVVPVDLLKHPPIAFALLASVATFTAQAATYIAMPFFFEREMQRPVVEVGMLLAAWPIGTGGVALMAGYLSDKYSAALLSGLGAGLMALGIGVMTMFSVTVPNIAIMGCLFVAGLGFGLFQTPNNKAILSQAPSDRVGAVGGLQATTRVFGQSLGATCVTLIFSSTWSAPSRIALYCAMACAMCAILINMYRFGRV